MDDTSKSTRDKENDVKKEAGLVISDCLGNLFQEGDSSSNKDTITIDTPLNVSIESNTPNSTFFKQEIDIDQASVSDLMTSSNIVLNTNSVEPDSEIQGLVPVVLSTTSLSDQNVVKSELETENNKLMVDGYKIKVEPKEEIAGCVVPLDVNISNPPKERKKRKKDDDEDILEVLPVDSKPKVKDIIQLDDEEEFGPDDVERLFNPLEEKYEKDNFLGMGRIKCLLCKSIVSSSSFRCHLRTHCKYFPYQCGFCAFTATGRSLIEQHIKFKHRTVDFKILLTPKMEPQREAYLLLLRDNKFPADANKSTSTQGRSRIIQSKVSTRAAVQIANASTSTPETTASQVILTTAPAITTAAQSVNATGMPQFFQIISPQGPNQAQLVQTQLINFSNSSSELGAATPQTVIGINATPQAINAVTPTSGSQNTVPEMANNSNINITKTTATGKPNQENEISKHESSSPSTGSLEQFICTICGQHFGNRGALGIHVKYEIQRLPFSCKSCTFRCRTSKELEKHNTLKKHNQSTTSNKPSNQASVTCQICKGVYSQETIARHMKNHEEKESYQCSYCSFTCQGKNGLKEHMSKNHPGKPVCMVKLATKSTIRCQICRVNCSTQASLNVHVKTTHWKRECFCCGYCGFKSENRAVVVQHNKDSHPNSTSSVKVKYKQKDKVVKPAADSEEDVSNDENSDDEDSKSDDENIVVAAVDYDKEVENLDDIDDSVAIESPKKVDDDDENIAPEVVPQVESENETESTPDTVVPCPLCHKNLSFANIMSHLDTHLNQKFFQCIYCNYKADDRAITKSHIKQAHPNKPLFTISINMGTQMLSTAKEQVESELLNPSGSDNNKSINKLNCRLCPKKFPDIKSLTKHYRNSHGHVSCFFCIYCFTNLKSRDAMMSHILKDHEKKDLKFKVKFTLPINLDADGNPATKSPVYVYDAEETEKDAKASGQDSNAPVQDGKTSVQDGKTSVQNAKASLQNVKTPLQNLKSLTQNLKAPPVQNIKASVRPFSTRSEPHNFEKSPGLNTSDRKHVEVSSSNYIKPGCCPLCGREVDKNNVIRHMKIHFHMFKYQCKYCDFNKVEAYEIKRHILNKHKNKSVAIIEMTDNSNHKETQMKKYVDWFLTFNQEAPADKTPGVSKANRFTAAAEALKSLEPPNFTFLNPYSSSLRALRESGRLQCPACSFECVSQDLFNKHKRQHTFTEILYHCEYCTFKDYSESRVITHIKKFHVDEEVDIREVSQIQVMVGEKAGDITYQTVYAEIPKNIKLNPIIKLVDVAISHPHLMPKTMDDDSDKTDDDDDDEDDVIEVKDDEIYQVDEIWNSPRTNEIKVKMEIDVKDSECMDISENDFNFVIKKEKDEITDVSIKEEDPEDMQLEDQSAESVENNVEEISLVIKQEMDTF